MKLRLTKSLGMSATLIVVFSACAQESHQSQPTTQISCRAPGTPSAIEEALCSGSPRNLRQAIFDDSSAPDAQILSAFQRVFDGDARYGQALPWEALKTPRIRAITAEYLAQAIRNGDYEHSLESLQEFAIRFVREAKSDGDQLDGIRLLGIVDAATQVPALRATAISKEGSPTRRAYAIDALGRICAPEAAAALDEVKRATTPGGVEAKHLATARVDRERLKSSWCRTALPSAALSRSRAMGSADRWEGTYRLLERWEALA
jgi:hypothetical protein